MVVDGVEIMRMIRDGEIKNETLIEDKEYNRKYKYNAEIESFYEINEEEYEMMHYYTDKEFASTKFEILSEEDKEIDIQEMQGVNLFSNGVNSSEDTKTKCYDNNFVIIEETLSELQKAIKQIDKK